jgi:hypothetical protein
MRITLDDCWAKTDDNAAPSISVRSHCLFVGAVSEALIQSLPPSVKNLFPDGGAALIAAHDIGKITPGFLMKCPALKGVRHKLLTYLHSKTSNSFVNSSKKK